MHEWLDALFDHYPFFFAHFDFNVLRFWVNSKHRVCDKREGHSRPNKEILILCSGQFEFEVETRIFHDLVGVFVAYFGAAETGLAAWTVSNNVVSLFQQVLIPSAFEVLPFAFNVAVIIGPVGFVVVHEDAY